MSSTPPPPSTVPAGWYDDGSNPSLQRYWDGTQWTDHTAPRQAVPAPPAAAIAAHYPAPTAPMSRAKKGWIVAGSIVAGLIVLGSVSNAVNGNRTPVADVAPVVTPTETPVASATPTTPPAPVAETAVIDVAQFQEGARGHLADMNKDLDDMVTTLQEDGFWRLLSNTVELSFNVGQLQSLDVPPSIAGEWDVSLGALSTSVEAMSELVTKEDSAAISAQIDAIRSGAVALNGIIDRAQ